MTQPIQTGGEHGLGSLSLCIGRKREHVGFRVARKRFRRTDFVVPLPGRPFPASAHP